MLTLERPADRCKDSERLNGHGSTNGAAPKVCFITREYPPSIYGGAGVHIKNLARELAQVMDVEVRCFGDQDLTEGRLRVKGYQPWSRAAEGAGQRFNSVLGTFSTDLSIVRDPLDAIVHAHTWYAAMAGFMAKELYDVPLVVTIHSLEPLRPWKEEQLGRSYHLSTWIERIALEAADRVIAVSSQSKSARQLQTGEQSAGDGNAAAHAGGVLQRQARHLSRQRQGGDRRGSRHAIRLGTVGAEHGHHLRQQPARSWIPIR